MHKHLLASIYGTFAILIAWAAAIAYFQPGNPDDYLSSKERLAKQAESAPQERVVHEPRNMEDTGETARRHYLDEYGRQRKTEIDFADMSKATIGYSVFGKAQRIVDRAADGASVVYHLDPMNSTLLSVERLRADGTLYCRIQPGESGSVRRNYFAPDGKTLACRQEINADGTLSSDIFFEDGKSIRARYRLEPSADGAASSEHCHDECYSHTASPLSSTLQVFDRKGLLVAEEKIMRMPCEECGDFECGNEHEEISVKIFENGTLKITQQWQAYSGSEPSLQSAVEFSRNGSKLRSLTSCYEKVSEKEHASYRLDHLGADGKALSSDFMNSNGKLLLQKDRDGRKKLAVGQAQADLEILSQPVYHSLPQEYLNPAAEKLRLQQILSK